MIGGPFERALLSDVVRARILAQGSTRLPKDTCLELHFCDTLAALYKTLQKDIKI